MTRFATIFVALLVIVTVALADDVLLRSGDNVLDCAKVDCGKLVWTTTVPEAYLTLHTEPAPAAGRIGFTAGNDWVRLGRIIRALIEHDPAFADEVLKFARATYRYQDGRTLGYEAAGR